jgi:hypothetical protein
MPSVRKVPAAEAASWPPDYEPVDADALLAEATGADRTGLTRMDYPAKRMHGWMARVYGGGGTSTRFWADASHGGALRALRKAIEWRDAKRQTVERLPRGRGRTWRIVRTDRPDRKHVGYFAYADRRRYFSDATNGGPDGAKAAAEAWLADRAQFAGAEHTN